jgi:hypothetical protein
MTSNCEQTLIPIQKNNLTSLSRLAVLSVLSAAIVECKKKLYKTTHHNEVGWVVKPNVSDGLWACWVFNPSYPLCHFFLHFTIYLADTHSGESGGNGMAHINLTRTADVFVIAPASANTLAKIAGGIADNLLTNLAAARKCPLAAAPAMNVEMWFNPANQRNIARLQADGISIFPPASGEQACGETGVGRMPEAAELADLIPDLWTPKILAGKKVLITTRRHL